MSDKTSKRHSSIADDVLAARLAELDQSSNAAEVIAIEPEREAAATPSRRIKRQRWNPGRKPTSKPSKKFRAWQTKHEAPMLAADKKARTEQFLQERLNDPVWSLQSWHGAWPIWI